MPHLTSGTSISLITGSKNPKAMSLTASSLGMPLHIR